MPPSKYWMVVGAGVPHYRHPTKVSAFREAERLAKLHRDRLDVVEAIGRCQVADVVWTQLVDLSDAHEDADAEVPF